MNEEQIFTYLTSTGLAPHQAAGLMGSIAQESGFNPRAVNPKSKAVGLFQHLGPRKAALHDFARKSGRDPLAADTQLDFAINELNGPEAKARASLMSAPDVDSATLAFSHDFERAGKAERNDARRISKAREILDRMMAKYGMPALDAMIPKAQADEIPPPPPGFDYDEPPIKAQAEIPPPPPGFDYDEPPNQGAEAAKDIALGAAKMATGIGEAKAEDAPKVGYSRDDDPLGKAKFAANSFNKGAAGLVDSFINAPVNAANLLRAGAGYALGEMGAPASWLPELQPTPDLARRSMEYLGAIHPALEPRNSGERVMDFALQNAAGASMLPLARIAAARMPNSAAFSPETAGDIARTTAREAGIGLGSGVAGGLVTEATGSPLAGIFATMAAPSAMPGMKGFAAKARNWFPDTTWTDAGRRNIVADSILNASDNPEALSSRLRFGATGELGYPNTTAEAARDYGLASLQRTVQQSPGQILMPDGELVSIQSAFRDNEAGRRAAQVEAMHEAAPARGGAMAFQDAIRRKVAEVLGTVNLKSQAAQDAMGRQITPEYAGAAIRNAIGGNRAKLKAQESAAWSAIDPDGTTALTLPVKQVDDIVNKYFGEGSGGPPASISGIAGDMRTLANREAAAVGGEAINATTGKSKRGPVDPEMDSLSVAVRKLGGLNITHGGDELAWLRESVLGKPHPVFGPLARRDNKGDTFDGMAERLHQFGYLDEPTPGALLDALEAEARGVPVFSVGMSDAAMRARYAPRDDGMIQTEAEPLNDQRVTLQTLQNLKSRAGEAEAKAKREMNHREAAAAGQIRQAIQDHIDAMAAKEDGLTYEQAKDYFGANALSKERFDRFESGAARKLMERDKGGQKIEDAEVPKAFLGGSPADVAQFFKAIESGYQPSKAAMTAAEDYLSTDLRNRIHAPDGTLKKGWQNEWMKWEAQMRPVLNRFPELKARVLDARRMQSSASVTTEALTEGGARFFLVDKDADKAVKAWLSGQNRKADTKSLVQLIRNDDTAKSQLEGAIKDMLLNNRMQQGARDSLGNPEFNSGSALKFLTDPANRDMMRYIFGNDHVAKWDRIARDLEQSRFVQSTVPRGQSITGQHAQNMAYMSGAKYLGSLLAGVFKNVPGVMPGAGMVKSVYEAAKIPAKQQLESLRARAMLDPKLAAVLVENLTAKNKGIVDEWISRNLPRELAQDIVSTQAERERLGQD